MALSKKHQAFIDEYFLCGMNATEAYSRAYPKASRETARRNGSDLLTNTDIAAEIQRRLKEKRMSADEVLVRLADMARADIADFVEVERPKDLLDTKYQGKTHVVKKFKKTTVYTKKGDTIVTTELELHDSRATLVDLGRHHKLFTDKVELVGWQKELVDLLKQGEITPDDIKEELGDELAREFFESAGFAFAGVGAPETEGQTADSTTSAG